MNKEFIQKLTGIVEANMAEETFSIEELAREMGMSHSNLHRKLRITSNQNISQFIREVRLKKAKELLLDEDLTASEIAYRVGFGSPTYFNKCFHEYFGRTPGEFRTRESESESIEIAVDKGIGKPHLWRLWVVLIICFIILIALSILLFGSLFTSLFLH